MNVVTNFFLTIAALLMLTGCIAGTAKIKAPSAVAELLSVEIGGMDQWVLIRGEDKSNPILLWLHGGPGAAQIPVHRAFNKDLEKEFVVVHWDQRGAGKSNHSGFSEETMTLDRFIEDVHEMTQYLKERFGREKIFLLGHSWGTQLGILTVQRYPDDYHGFISVAQVVHPQRAEEISYEWLSKQVEERGSSRQMRKFDELGPPLYDEHDRYVTFAKMKDAFGGSMDIGMGRLAWISFGANEYTIGDYAKWLRGANRGSGPMWEELRDFDLFRDIPSIEIPVWFIVGENDQNTPAELVEEYYEFVDAPRGKEFMIMERTAHTPFMGDPERFNREVVRIKQAVLKGVR
jgi:pimeloyl-ACP methyl ester carboxylesterase